MKQYRVNTTFRNAGMGHRMEKWGKKQDQDWAGLTVLVVIFQHARLRVNPKVLGQLGPKISLGVAQKAYFMVQLWLPAPFLNRYSIFLAAPKFLLSTLSLAPTHSFSYRPSNIPSRCCRAFHTSLWNKHGNVLKAVFYPFCASSKSATYKLHQNLLPALLQ